MKPEVSARETRRREAIQRAKEIVGQGGFHPNVYKTRDAILALGDGATIEEIRACSVGNCGPRPALKDRCDGCGELVDAVAMVGAEPDYESATAELCEACLEAALSALRAAL